MFNQLSDKLSNTINRLRGVGRLTEDNIKDTLKDIRLTLLDADVALPVVNEFIDRTREKVIGAKVLSSVRPGEALVKIVKDELTELLSAGDNELQLKDQPPVVILMAGLQGSGKTTSTAKLAHWLQQTEKKKILMVSTDVYRPAALEQLDTLGKQIDIDVFPVKSTDKPLKIAKAALDHARKQHYELLFIDTAGRLHIDDTLMEEIKALEHATQPKEVLLVVDSMTGQDAAKMAKSFNDALSITGVILSKTDGDARGGAALSMCMLTGKPIKFIGVGEKIDALERFYPERMAQRILGMGDILSLVEEAQRKVDDKKAAKLSKKIKKGKRFDFNDFLEQLKQMKKMGGMKSLMAKLPGMGKLPQGAAALADESLFVKMEAIILSMTPKERRFPALINGSRKKRIAKGSGNQIQDVNKLLKQFTQMQKMLKRFKGDKMMKKMKNMQQNLPPELQGLLPDEE